MSRSGYSDECENVQLWRQAVTNATFGKRGQAFLKEMLTALDSLPEKKLIADELVTSNGEVCAIGSVAKLRGIDVEGVEIEDRDEVAGIFNIAPALAAEIVYLNDERYGYKLTPEERFEKMRAWTVSQIIPDEAASA